jgi:hypothetical protein
MRYTLDLTGAKMPPAIRKVLPDLIPVRDGRHQRDFDVIEEELPPAVVRRMRAHIKRNSIGFNDDMPVGFDALTAFCSGARLTDPKPE